MSEKLKVADKGAVDRIKGRLNKLIDRPVSKKLVDALIREGDLERERKKEEDKRVASEQKNQPAEM